MKDLKLTISCKGVIANRVLVPETLLEKFLGMYGRKAEQGTAMMFIMCRGELLQMYDMIWMKEPLGYIALNKNKEIIDVGVMRPWFSFKIVKCMYFIETHPLDIRGLEKGDIVKCCYVKKR